MSKGCRSELRVLIADAVGVDLCAVTLATNRDTAERHVVAAGQQINLAQGQTAFHSYSDWAPGFKDGAFSNDFGRTSALHLYEKVM